MQGIIINVYYLKNTYKKAICKGCYDKLVEGCKILSVVRSQGKFTSVSNYCSKCAEIALQSSLDEVMPLMQNMIKIQETLDAEKAMTNKIEKIAKEAMIEYDTTMQHLGNR